MKINADGTVTEVKTHDLVPGDVIRVRPGDNIPADGDVTRGMSSVNQATITGESLPVDKQPGDEVFAGTSNLNGMLEIKVRQVAGQTTIGKVRDLILKAEQTRLPIMRIIDQYMGYYTPLVLVVAALVWLFTRDLDRVISVMVVLCPVAFVLATPSAMVAALSAASRLGILIKNVADLEAAGRISGFIFDKTGTLTTGQLAVQRLVPVGDTQPAELLHLAASAESFSTHPTARALIRLAEEAGVTLSEPHDFKEVTGKGVTATIEGHSMAVGRAVWLREIGIEFDLSSVVDLDETEGFSLIFVARDGRLIGWMGLRDQTRDQAAAALEQLQALRIQRIAMVTGDREPVARRVAREIGCQEVAADCLPQDKVDFVNRVRSEGYRLAVVGDGVNDAPALAAGDLGIAMGAAGSEVAINSATIALMNNDLNRLPFLVKLSRTTRRVINQNFLIGLIFILGGLVLASAGYLNPVIAAILQNAGSLMVVFNSARLVRQGEELSNAPVGDSTPS
jgi:Cd2+/Zn2+-exporting ATPase